VLPGFAPAGETLLFRQKGPKPLTPRLALGEPTDANPRRADQLAALKQGPPTEESVPSLGQTAGAGAEVKKSKAYHPDLIESLRDAREAEEYLNAALEEGDPELFLLALRNVAEAQGGVAQLAEKAKLNRKSLYKILSERGNPELKSLDALLNALGFRLAVTATR